MNSLPMGQKRAVASQRHNGGPVELVSSPKSSKLLRGLKQTNPTPPLHSKVIMEAGRPLMTKRLGKILAEIMASRAKLDAELSSKTKAQSRVTRDAPKASWPGGVPSNAQSTAKDEGRINVKSSGSGIPVAKAGARVP